MFTDKLEVDNIQITRTKRHKNMEKCCMCPRQEAENESPWITEATFMFFSRAGEGAQELRHTLLLCPFHEISLIEKLVNNLEKRLKRGGKAHPIGILPRKNEEEDDESGDSPDAGSA